MFRIVSTVSVWCILLVAMFCCGPGYAETKQISAQQVAPFVSMAIDCAVQEYPNKIAHTMQSDADQGTPESLHPSFYGCFDWHSSVHGHWLAACGSGD